MEEERLLKKLDEVKVLRDPIHSYIHVEYEVVWKCIDSKWMQRLRRIKQLGGAFLVYHTADHTRFGHSLGTYEIVRRMVSEIPDLNAYLSEEEKVIGMLAALLHDVGHGPFSHAFEAITNVSHEQYTCKIIEDETSEIYSILESYKKGLSHEVTNVLRHTHKNRILSQLVSSQLDADRMDYLLRDAYFTGTKYGEFDLERLFRVMRVVDDQLVIKKSGVYAVENYIMARYHMYWQVYYHPVARSYESMLELLFKRLRDVNKKGNLDPSLSFLKPLFQDSIMSLDAYFTLDEPVCIYTFHVLTRSDDPVLKDLATRLLNRKLFKDMDLTEANVRRVKRGLKQFKYNPAYYFQQDKVGQKPYEPYKEEGKDICKAIYIQVDKDQCKELSQVSSVVGSLVKGRKEIDGLIFYPRELKGKL